MNSFSTKWLVVFSVALLSVAAIIGLQTSAGIDSANIANNSILAEDFSCIDFPLNGEFYRYDSGSAGCEWGAVDVSTDVSGILPIANGGTNSATAAGARTNLNVDVAGTDNSTDVTLVGVPDYITIAGQVITRGLVDLTNDVSGDLPVSEGGTGSSTASAARTALGVDVAGTDNTTWESDLWRLTTTTTGDGCLCANLERVDTKSQGKSGVGMSEASGIFTFPETGTYLVVYNAYFRAISGADLVIGAEIWTTPNASTYSAAAIAVGSLYAINADTSISTRVLLNVSNTANIKVRFHRSNMFSSNEIFGHTTYNYTTFYFLRVGDST